ncbi:MAG: hypothetical protein GC192_17625 [Bacteroidetes bacterium]|nr:hypothetical protein [Bacteroidota bacterium]
MASTETFSQEEKLKNELVLKAFKFAGINVQQPDHLLRSDFLALSAKLLKFDSVFEVSADSVKRLWEATTPGKWKRNKAKDILALYVLHHEGKLQQIPTKNEVKKKLHDHYFDEYVLFFNENPLLRVFQQLDKHYHDTWWHLYILDIKGKIYKHVLFFSNETEVKLNKVRLFNAYPNYHDYTGWAGLDESKSFIIINLFTEESKHKDLHFKIKIQVDAKPDCLVGQANFIASHESLIISDHFVLMKAPNPTEKYVQGRCPLALESYDPANGDFEKLHPSIRSFFYDGGGGKLISPNRHITSAQDLLDWVIEDRSERFRTKSIEPYCGEYMIYHLMKLNNGTVEVDELEFNIWLDEHAHRVQTSLKLTEGQSCQGLYLEKHERFITCLFEGWNDGKRKNIFLEFDAGTSFYEAHEWFAGLLAGVHRSGHHGMSVLCIVVKKGVPGFLGKDDPRVMDYLSSRDWQIQMESSPDHKLASLVKDVRPIVKG